MDVVNNYNMIEVISYFDVVSFDTTSIRQIIYSFIYLSVHKSFNGHLSTIKSSANGFNI